MPRAPLVSQAGDATRIAQAARRTSFACLAFAAARTVNVYVVLCVFVTVDAVSGLPAVFEFFPAKFLNVHGVLSGKILLLSFGYDAVWLTSPPAPCGRDTKDCRTCRALRLPRNTAPTL